MGVRSRSKRRRRGAPAVGADRISGLCDDVLVRILELLPDAGDAVRTGALSRRWRGLWRRTSSLTFHSSGIHRDHRFLDFVHDALAQRAKTDAGLDLEHLAISFAIMSPDDYLFSYSFGEPAQQQEIKQLVLRSADAAQEWIRYAMEKATKSFVLKLQFLSISSNCYKVCEIGTYNLVKPYRLEKPMIDLNDLPSSAKLETMHWDLKDVELQLPHAAVFASLVDLSLENIDLGVGGGHLLARLLSSACCPSLQKLLLRNLMLPLLDELLIEASALLELTIKACGSPIADPKTLKLKTCSLRILRLENCDYHGILVGISAPKLEELIFLPKQPDHIQVDGELPCVESLKVRLTSRGYEDDDGNINDGGICLLRCCTSLTCLEVSLQVTTEKSGFTDIISGRIPHLPHIISLTVHAYLLDMHSFGVGLAEILKQCSYLKYLCVHSIQKAIRNDSLCNHPYQWKSHQIYLAKIHEVRFTGLAGTDCESSFVKGVLAHATQLQKVDLSLDPRFRPHNMMYYYSESIPCGGGTWVFHDQSLSCQWKSDPIHK